MDKRRSCANCGSADHHVADCTTYKQGMKSLGYAPDEEDMSQMEEHEFYSGLIIKTGASCFFCNQEGHFRMDCPLFWEPVKNQSHPKHKSALAAVQNTRNRQAEFETRKSEATNAELPTKHQLMIFLGFANYYRELIKGYADKVYPMQQLMSHKGKKFTWNNAAEESFQRKKKYLCEAPVLGMPTEKGMYVLDTDASVVSISGILHQEQEWNGKTVFKPIAYGSKVLSDTEMKYGAPKAEMFAVVTFVEKYRAYLGSEPFKQRVDNRALSWLKTYSMDQSYIGRWIVRLDGYNKIIEHRTRDKHQNGDSLSKKTEFYERQD